MWSCLRQIHPQVVQYTNYLFDFTSSCAVDFDAMFPPDYLLILKGGAESVSGTPFLLYAMMLMYFS